MGIDAKTRILNVAERIFAEKGFDGARVDEIAREANVNKALIYYYFKSKKAIQEELFNEFIRETIQMIEDSMEEITDFDAPEKLREYFDIYLDFWENRKGILRILMMESLKESTKDDPLFKFLDIIMRNEEEKIKAVMEKNGLSMDYDRMEGMICDFFTGLMPIFHFILYKDEWGAHYGIGGEELDKKFYDVLTLTHLNYHRVRMDQLKEEAQGDR